MLRKVLLISYLILVVVDVLVSLKLRMVEHPLVLMMMVEETEDRDFMMEQIFLLPHLKGNFMSKMDLSIIN